MLESIKKANTNLSGLISILADNLYSTPEVAIRELVQNAHDAITRASIEGHQINSPRIDVKTLSAEKILEFSDNGSGLTKEEIEEFLATIAKGYTRKLRTERQENKLIGFFGLGFLSTYVVSNKVEVITTSYQTPEETWCFSSRNAETYTVSQAPAGAIGTTVRLHLNEDHEHFMEYGELHRILNHYCPYLDVPIHLNDAPAPINYVEPPWTLQYENPIKKQKELIAFCSEVSKDFQPLSAFEVPTGDTVSGVLWIHDASTYGGTDNRRISVYLRGMLLSPNDRDLLPSWAGFVSGIVNSTNLTPTASRETLKKDELYALARKEIALALINGLKSLANENQAAWRQVMKQHNQALRGAALADATLFHTLRNKLTVPTNKGELTVSEILERSGGKIYVSLGDEGSAEEVLFSSMNIPVVKGYLYAALAYCKYYVEQSGQPVVILGEEKNEENIFSVEEPTEETQPLLDFLVDKEHEEGVLAHFKPEFMPLIKIPNRQAILKHEIESDEADQRLSQAVLTLARQTVKKIEEDRFMRVYINLSSPITKQLLRMPADKQNKCIAIMRAFCDIPLSNETLPIKQKQSPYQSFFENFLELIEE